MKKQPPEIQEMKNQKTVDLWIKKLGKRTDGSDFPREIRLERRFSAPDFDGELYRQRTEPDVFQRVLLMFPKNFTGKCPGVLMPFYYPERLAGYELTEPYTPYPPEQQLIAWGTMLVKQGYIVCAPETCHLNLTATGERSDFSRWSRAAAELLRRHPDWTGLGKLIHDARLALDLLAQDPRVDACRLAAAGHSLGGKLAFYTGCMDERIRVMICSDFGIRWQQSNWQEPWYWGEKLQNLQAGKMEQKELLAAAGKPLFLIAGNFDDESSKSSLQPGDGFFNHATGHTPTPDSMAKAWQFLAEHLG